jgi:hypothetical protein
MAGPEPALAPPILPVLVPSVHEKLLVILAVNVMFGEVPLHIAAVAAFVTDGAGLTVIFTEGDMLVHPPEVTVLWYQVFTVIAGGVKFIALAPPILLNVVPSVLFCHE